MTEEQSTDLVVVDRQGEVLTLGDATTDQLADALDLARERQRETKAVADAVAAELRARLQVLGRNRAVVGGWRIEAKAGRSREWDAEDLEAALETLVADGVVRAGEIADVITTTRKVNGTKALELLGLLGDGDAKAMLEACYRWKDGRPSVTVEPVAEEPAS